MILVAPKGTNGNTLYRLYPERPKSRFPSANVIHREENSISCRRTSCTERKSRFPVGERHPPRIHGYHPSKAFTPRLGSDLISFLELVALLGRVNKEEEHFV